MKILSNGYSDAMSMIFDPDVDPAAIAGAMSIYDGAFAIISGNHS